MLKRIAVFVSGGGSNMQAVMDKIDSGDINGKIVLVLSSSPKAYAITRAEKAGIPVCVLPKDLQQREEMTLAKLEEYKVDLCILAGYLGIVSGAVIKKYENKIINIHPSLIPSFCGKGFYGHYVHEAVLEYGAKVSGCTTHFVAEGIDTGAVIMQHSGPVMQDDTPETLAARILVQEHIIMPETVRLFCLDKLKVEGRIVKILD